MKEIDPFIKSILIGLIDKEIEELENHEFTFYSEREIHHTIPNRPTVFDWFTHGYYYDNITQKKVVVSEDEARFNREVLIPIEIQDTRNVYERLELLKDIKRLLEGNRICLEEL